MTVGSNLKAWKQNYEALLCPDRDALKTTWRNPVQTWSEHNPVNICFKILTF